MRAYILASLGNGQKSLQNFVKIFYNFAEIVFFAKAAFANGQERGQVRGHDAPLNSTYIFIKTPLAGVREKEEGTAWKNNADKAEPWTKDNIYLFFDEIPDGLLGGVRRIY